MKTQTQSPQSEVDQPLVKPVKNLKKGGIRPHLRAIDGAGNGDRTRDTKLGKLVLYQLSYARSIPHYRPSITVKKDNIVNSSSQEIF